MAIAAAGVLLVASFAGGAAAGPGKSTTPREGARPVAIADPATRFVPGEVLVGFRSGVSAAERTAALASQGATRVRNLKVPGVVLAKLAPGKGVQAAVDAFSKRADVAYAEPNWIYRAAATPNDPRYTSGELWGLNQLGDVDIDAPEAWDVTTGSSNVIVAVVDTGVAYDHPDLSPNIWVNDDPVNGIDDDGNGFVDDVRGWDFIDNDNDPRDGNGHGTHVAGTIGAKGNNAVGVTGVNWNVKLMPVRVLGPEGGTNEQVADGFIYAAANGAKVVNASLGGSGFSTTMQNAINAATGTLFVVAAGNDGEDNEFSATYPCNYTSSNLICVAATTRIDGLAEFSNFGTTSVDLGAPGTEIVSTWLAHDSILTEGFETDTGWAGGGEPNTWARTTESSIFGSWSATDSPGGFYADDPDDSDPGELIDNWFQMPGTVNLSGRSGCSVRYAMKLNTEFEFDYFVVHASTDGSNWTEVAAWTGTTPDFPTSWFFFEDDLSGFDGQPNVFLRFGMDTDETVFEFDGVHIDGAEVRCISTNYTASSYNEIEGTSMATPHVAGVAALAWAKNASATVAQVRTALLNGGDAIASLAGTTVTGRRLNAVGTLGLIPFPANLSINDVSVTEGNSGTANATFTVTLSPGLGTTVTVNYATANGTATAPGDYTASSGTVTFTPGQTSRPITVPIVGDTVEESTETFVVNLSAAVNAGITDAQGVLTITDNDTPVGNFGLSVTKGGTGFGVVTGTGLNCGTDCFESYASGTPVTLTATAGHGSIFASWTGCDAPSGSSCTMTMNSAKSVTANFTATPTFADVPPSNPFYEFIEHLFDLGITTGCGTNASSQLIFCPGDPVPRQQMAAFLIRAKGLTQLFPASPSFTDVPASNPFFGYIERLREQGITTGCNPPTNNLFCPLEFVPRQQMAAFLIRAKGLTPLPSPVPTFADVPNTNPFYGHIERLFETGITTGCGFNASSQRIYCPGDNVPRQQMAAFLIRAFAP